VDHEQPSITLRRTARCDGGYSLVKPVNDSALAKELIVIRFLGSGVEVFERGESWKIEVRIEFDILGFHNNTKSQISFNKIMALHSMAVKEASSSA
jgi:hypothetical protein